MVFGCSPRHFNDMPLRPVMPGPVYSILLFDQKIRLIEVKDRRAGAAIVVVTTGYKTGGSVGFFG